MNIERQWAVVSVVTGVLTVLSYTMFSIISGPFRLGVILVCAFGILLATASLGLYHVLAQTGNCLQYCWRGDFYIDGIGATVSASSNRNTTPDR